MSLSGQGVLEVLFSRGVLDEFILCILGLQWLGLSNFQGSLVSFLSSLYRVWFGLSQS